MQKHNSRLKKFLATFSIVLIIMFVFLFLTEVFLGNQDYLFYQILIPAMIVGAFFIAFINIQSTR